MIQYVVKNTFIFVQFLFFHFVNEAQTCLIEGMKTLHDEKTTKTHTRLVIRFMYDNHCSSNNNEKLVE